MSQITTMGHPGGGGARPRMKLSKDCISASQSFHRILNCLRTPVSQHAWNQHRGHQMGSSGLRYWASYEPLTPRSQEVGTMEPPKRKLEEEGGRMSSLDRAAATQLLTMVPPVMIWNERETLYPLKRSPVKTVLPYWKTNKYTPSTHQSVHDMFVLYSSDLRFKISREPRK